MSTEEPPIGDRIKEIMKQVKLVTPFVGMV